MHMIFSYTHTALNNGRSLRHRAVYVVEEHRHHGLGDVRLLSRGGAEFAEPLCANSGPDGVANVEEVRGNKGLVAHDRAQNCEGRDEEGS